MILIIGGAYQGKTEYAKEKYGVNPDRIYDAEIPKETEGLFIIDHLHEYIKKQMKEGKDPETELLELKDLPGCILISNEIGNGIVPMDPFEREYRERTGRILIKLAKEAKEVIRVSCGIGQKLK